MGDSVIRVSQSKTAIHTNGLVRNDTTPAEGNGAANGQAAATPESRCAPDNFMTRTLSCTGRKGPI
jgi:hypothetical protein